MGRIILLISWEYPPHVVGGLARHVHGLAKGLFKRGHEVHVLTANSDEDFGEDKSDSIHIHRVEPLNENDGHFFHWIAGLNLAMEERARELHHIYCFDIIHAHDWLVGASAITLHKYLYIPFITTIHATEYGRNNGIFTELQRFVHHQEKMLAERSNHLIVCSQSMKEELFHLFTQNSDKMTVIPNGTEKNNLPVKAHYVLDSLPINFGKRLIFSIGRMVEEKGFTTLIEAAETLIEQNDQVYFIVAGKGPLLEPYRQKVRERLLDHVFFFPGFITDQQRTALLNICEIAVFPSKYEPFGIVALEAMAAERPVIVSRTGGLKGLVQHRQTGMLMDPGNVCSLIEQTQYLLNHPLHAKEMGKKARRIVDDMYNWDRVAEETESVYEAALLQSNLTEIKKI
ncbi:glycosyltransferase family 4 protein [Cytobacillus purgationiresistens]|uniref:Glycosyltransferase involved in cell wall biosynthesis n=1 Tax=Cytobacillus purgationiresistens TaxID=863449 RepID=A0ABU0ADX4_9BACI|nr:glycosyltransferase family 4 protein [Cytobacillus purgationiresistens]MDQ0269447.1 glycosyltransferase involved in cell wall biosynthesis [Cytobacillus purgationiresistens]